MPLDPRVQRFLGLLKAGNPPDARTATVAERRSGLTALMKLGYTPIALPRVEDRTLPGPAGPLQVRVYSPVDDDAPRPGLVYFHGGGLVAGSIDTHDAIARGLAANGSTLPLTPRNSTSTPHGSVSAVIPQAPPWRRPRSRPPPVQEAPHWRCNC